MGSVRTRVSCTIACRGRGYSTHETEAPTRVLEGRVRSRSVRFGPSAAELIQPSGPRYPSTNDLVLCGRTPQEPFRPPGLPTSGGSFRPLDRLGLPRRFVHRLSIGLSRFRNRSIPGRPRSETGNERTTLGNVDTRGEIQRLPWFQRGSERMRNRTAWRGGWDRDPCRVSRGGLNPIAPFHRRETYRSRPGTLRGQIQASHWSILALQHQGPISGGNGGWEEGFEPTSSRIRLRSEGDPISTTFSCRTIEFGERHQGILLVRSDPLGSRS